MVEPTHRLTNAEYHAHPALSRSALSTMNRSPLHFWHRYISGLHEEPAIKPAALTFGTAVHTAVLEPKEFARYYDAAPEGSKNTKAYKEAVKEAEATGVTLLTTAEMDKIDGIKASLFAHPMASEMLFKRSGRNETTWIAKDPVTGMELKARPDRLAQSGAIVDLKTSANASAKHFQRSAHDFGYHIQAAFYQMVLNLCTAQVPNFYFVVVEKEPPYAVQCFRASSNFLLYGKTEVRRLLDSIWLHKRTHGVKPWPSYSESVVALDLPPWLKT